MERKQNWKKLQNPIIFWRILRRCLPLRYHHDLFFYFLLFTPLSIPTFYRYRCIRCSIFLCLFEAFIVSSSSSWNFNENTVGPLLLFSPNCIEKWLVRVYLANREKTGTHTRRHRHRCERSKSNHLYCCVWLGSLGVHCAPVCKRGLCRGNLRRIFFKEYIRSGNLRIPVC